MSSLTDLQVELIRGDIRQNGIEMTDLEDDLLDHICCALEEELDVNSSFESAYSKIKSLVCPNGYREIQEETTQLLTLKFNKMRKTMNILGIIGSALLLVGSIFKLQHWPGAGVSLVLGGAILVLGYLPFMLSMSLKQTDKTISKIRNVVGYLSSTAIVVGVIFKLQHWPEARLILLGGIGIFLVFFIPLFIKSVGKEAIMKIQPVTSAVLLMAIVSILFAFSNQSHSYNYVSSLADINDDLEQNLEFQNRSAEKLRAQHTNEALSKSSEDVVSYVDGLKQYILTQVNPEEKSTQLHPEDGPRYIEAINNDVLVENFNAHEFSGEELQKMLLAHNEFLSDNKINVGKTKAWLATKFSHQPLFVIFNKLTQIQIEIVNAEINELGSN